MHSKIERTVDQNGNSSGAASFNSAPFSAASSGTNGALAAASVQVYDSTGNIVGNYTTIQAAVNAVTSSNNTIVIGGGTYAEQVTISGKTNLTIQTGPNATVRLSAPADLVDTATAVSGRAVDGVLNIINSTGLKIAGITVDGAAAGATADGNANFVGIYSHDSTVNLSNVSVTGVRDATISGAQRGTGILVDNTLVASSPTSNPNAVVGPLAFTMTGGSITDFQKNGAFFIGANVSMSGVTVTGAGATGVTAQNGVVVFNSTGSVSGNTVSGIGYTGTTGGAYSGLVLAASNTGLAITNNTLTGTNGTSTDSHVVGVFVYDNGTASSGGSIGGNTISQTDTGIDVSGLMGPASVTIGANTITSPDLTDGGPAGISYVPDPGTAIAFNLTGTAFSDTLGGGTLNDTLNGAGGHDTATFGGTRADSTISVVKTGDFVTGFTSVKSSGNGTDTLTGIEALRFDQGTPHDASDDITLDAADPIQLFNAAGTLTDTFTSLQDALDASSDGSVIRLRAGTYAEAVTIDHAVTILGANHGVAGTGDRGDETVITGINVVADGVTIDGVKITGTTTTPTFGTNESGVTVAGNDLTFTNSVLAGGPSSDPDTIASRAFLTTGVTGLDIGDNLISGYDQGIYISQGITTGSVHDNAFQGVDGTTQTGLANGIVSETAGVTIGDNSFDGLFKGAIVTQPSGVTGDGVTSVEVSDYVIDGNTFTNGVSQPVRIVAGPETNFVGTSYDDRFYGDFTQSDAVTFDGAGGNDVAEGTSQADTLKGGTGDDYLIGGGGDDTLNGGDGTDTAGYASEVAAATVSGTKNDAGFLTAFTAVTSTGGGTDTLSGIELVTFDQGTDDLADDVTLRLDASVQRFDGEGSLVGTYATIQAALDASADGDTLAIAAGTYDEALTINHAVTILGANSGIAGTGDRGAETVITGIDVVADGVTIDGVKIATTTTAPIPRPAVAVTDDGNGVTVTGNDLTLTNSILSGAPSSDSDVPLRAVSATDVTGLDIGDNLVSGYDQGVVIIGGCSSGSIHDNSFQGVDGTTQSGLANGVVTQSPGVSIGDNSFDGLYGGAIVTQPLDVTGDGDGITVQVGNYVVDGNVFTNGIAQPVQIIAGPETHFVGTAYDDHFFGSLSQSDAVTFDGAGGNDVAEGTAQADTLSGGTGNDVLMGGAGDDILDGGDGDDTITGGDGTDTVSYASATAVVTVSLAVATAQATGGSGSDTLTGIENLTGSDFGDTLTGSGGVNVVNGGAGDDSIDGGAGNDRLNGGDGDDTITGGAGNDIMDGGFGTDVASYANSTTSVFVSLGQNGQQVTGGGGTDTLSNFEGLAGGSAADTLIGNGNGNTLTGNGGNDVLLGNDGNDTLIGGIGNDTLNGGLGDDTADYSSATAGVTVDLNSTDAQNTGGAGTDTLFSIENIVGSAFADTLTGVGMEGTISGGDGNDVLTAGGNADDGGDELVGGDGNDLLISGRGDDVLIGGDIRSFGSTGNDTASFVNATAGVTATLGDDWVKLPFGTTASDAPIKFGFGSASGDGDDVLIGIANLTGSSFADSLTGNDNDNIFIGGTGGDTMTGMRGDDRYYVDSAADSVIEAANGGSDTVFTTVSYAIAAGQEVEKLQTTSSTGTTSINLTGNAFANTLQGNAGANTLNGGAGADSLYGFGGNDLYYVDNAADRVFEMANGGTDRVLTSVSYTLGAGQEIERLTTTGSTTTTAINLTGNEFDNILQGNAGANILNGKAGADQMFGFGGDDTYYVDNSADAVIEAAGGGNDRVFTTVSFALRAGQEIERLQTTTSAGTTAINLTGNEFANIVQGNAGDNVIDGKLGNDTLFGFAGADTFAFSTALNATTNRDVISDFANSTNAVHDTIRLSRSVFTALGAGTTLAAGAFKDITGGATLDSDDRILYNRTTGALSYDADGSGSGAAVQFATLGNKVTLSAADFAIG